MPAVRGGLWKNPYFLGSLLALVGLLVTLFVVPDREPPARPQLLDPRRVTSEAGSPRLEVAYEGATDNRNIKGARLWYRRGREGTWAETGRLLTSASGRFVIDDLLDGSTYYFDAVATDESGNTSPSPEGTDGQRSYFFQVDDDALDPQAVGVGVEAPLSGQQQMPTEVRLEPGSLRLEPASVRLPGDVRVRFALASAGAGGEVDLSYELPPEGPVFFRRFVDGCRAKTVVDRVAVLESRRELAQILGLFANPDQHLEGTASVPIRLRVGDSSESLPLVLLPGPPTAFGTNVGQSCECGRLTRQTEDVIRDSDKAAALARCRAIEQIPQARTRRHGNRSISVWTDMVIEGKDGCEWNVWCNCETS